VIKALLLSLLVTSAYADPVCLPADAGGTGTKALHHLVYDGGTASDARANGGTFATGGKAVTWWCPQQAFNGAPFWVLEWYGWEFSQDQFFGSQGFRPDDAEVVRQAWRATRSMTLDRTYFPTSVLMAAEPSRPKAVKK
jgi:hypothetical protein